jgi:hypothetical protein
MPTAVGPVMPVAHRVRQHVARHRLRQRLEPRRPVRQRHREQRPTQVVRQRLPDRPRRQRSEMVGDGVDQCVPCLPERVQVAGAQRASDRLAHAVSIFRAICCVGAAVRSPGSRCGAAETARPAGFRDTRCEHVRGPIPCKSRGWGTRL